MVLEVSRGKHTTLSTSFLEKNYTPEPSYIGTGVTKDGMITSVHIGDDREDIVTEAQEHGAYNAQVRHFSWN